MNIPGRNFLKSAANTEKYFLVRSDDLPDITDRIFLESAYYVKNILVRLNDLSLIRVGMVQRIFAERDPQGNQGRIRPVHPLLREDSLSYREEQDQVWLSD
jgi:hypothetical protein